MRISARFRKMYSLCFEKNLKKKKRALLFALHFLLLHKNLTRKKFNFKFYSTEKKPIQQQQQQEKKVNKNIRRTKLFKNLSCNFVIIERATEREAREYFIYTQENIWEKFLFYVMERKPAKKFSKGKTNKFIQWLSRRRRTLSIARVAIYLFVFFFFFKFLSFIWHLSNANTMLESVCMPNQQI